MSLACSACEKDMGPSESFPGREGTMVYPNVLAMIWAGDETPDKQWPLHYVMAPGSISLCFRCIVDALPEDRKSILEKVWSAYETETAYELANASERGRWLAPEEITSSDLFNAWKGKYKVIAQDQYVFCAKAVPDNQNPYFTAQVIDKVYCKERLTLFFGQNYSWSDLKTGMTGFNICFVCFGEYFPASFRDLGYGLRGDRQSGRRENPKTELYLTSQFIEALKGEVGDERAHELLSAFQNIKLAADPDSMQAN